MNTRASWVVPPIATRVLTDRLSLRPPRTGDVPELRRALRANADHLRPWSVAPVPGEDPTSLASVSTTVMRNRREWKRGQALVLMITPREDEDRIIGRIALGGLLLGAFQNAYVGYWIDAEHQGRGLMTEAVRATTTFAFRVAGLHRLQAAVMPGNTAEPARVLAKVGYRREGAAPAGTSASRGPGSDHEIFAVTSEEWRDESARPR